MLKDLLESKKCFKLVCGAGNEDIQEVERLVYVYAKAGCRFFDLSANANVIKSAQRGFFSADVNDTPYFCVSFGIKGDPHVCKATINKDKCTLCNICESYCPQNAINDYKVKNERCIGCLKCFQECAFDAVELAYEDITPSDALKEIDIKQLSCIELHANSCDENDLFAKWNDISNFYDGLLSICIDRSNLGNKQLIDRINKMLKNRKPYSTIVQADGIPMSGSNDDYKTTLQAVAIAQIVQDAKIPAYLILSGGTNSKTAELAKLCGINANGVAIGSFARKIVKEFISIDDFYNNKSAVDDAINRAKQLIDVSLEYMGRSDG